MNTLTTHRTGAWILVALIGSAPSPARAQDHFPQAGDLELMLRFIVEDGEAPAVALGVVEADGSATAVAYGDPGPGGRPLGARSVFEIGGLTMTFTATLLAEMAARGEVSLDDPVAEYVPGDVTVPSLADREITLIDLATHRSGLPAGPPEPVDELTEADLYAFLSDYRPDWAPGRHREYSPLGYGLLGLALARAAGTPLPELLRDRILEPLGMDDTGYALDGATAEWSVRGRDGGDVVPYDVPTPAMQGATGLRSSARDMAAFVRANAAPPTTDLERAMRVAQEVRTPFDPEGEGWGFSWRTYAVGRQPLLVTHGGETAGFTALVSFDTERGIGTVVLAATRGFHDWTARDLLYPEPAARRAEARVDPAILRRYEGTYGSTRRDLYRATRERGRYFIRADDGYLTYQPAGSVRTPLYATSDSTFYMKRGPYTVTFAGRGDAMRMIVRVDDREEDLAGTTWTARRIEEATPPPAVVAGNAPFWATWSLRRWALLGVLTTVALVAILRPLWVGPVLRRGTG